jgi:mono/diheme cytochrome c family protein
MNNSRIQLCLAPVLMFAVSAGAADLPKPHDSAVEYQRDIAPILSEHCIGCHGAKKQKGGLRLDVGSLALAGGDEGKVITPGNSAASKLIELVAGLKEKTMPPKGERLPAVQIAKLRRWIDDGAKWPESGEAVTVNSEHWAYQNPIRPRVPVLKNNASSSAIDAFVLRRLKEAGIRPSASADRSTLIRRLSLDLIGLPPTPDEVDLFLGDSSPRAYENLVDRLLASSHFGERWGRHWLDLARYADSDGYEKDRARPYAYVYRDWVIQAVNEDLPFDEFSIQQLAGDLLPDASLGQKIATGFHRQTLTNTEGGTDQEEFRCKSVVDRVSTTATTWLGVTMGCAECHTHKYDPFTQREFYQFFAFFNDASEKNLPAPQSDELGRYESALKKWEGDLGKHRLTLKDYETNDLPKAFAEWAKNTTAPDTQWHILSPSKVQSANGATLKADKTAVVISSGKNPGADTYSFEAATALQSISGIRLEAIDDPSAKKGPGRSSDGNFVLTRFALEMVLADGGVRKIVLQNPKANFSQSKFDVSSSLLGKTSTGWAVSPRKNEDHVAVYETKGSLVVPEGALLRFTLEHKYKTTYLLQRFRISVTDSPAPFVPSRIGDKISAALAKVPAERSKADQSLLLGYYRDTIDKRHAALAKQVSDRTAKKPKYPPTFAATIIREPKGRQTQIHKRGNFMDRGDKVDPLTPAVLHPLKARDKRPDRLDLARWLFAADNPLTGRVSVNHIWQHLFGRGLVSTADDFGSRGEAPSHPELLDWLATEFPRLGWSRKALIKTIVMSTTYRQSSRQRPELLDRDPQNVLLARQSRLRLSAEVVRDSYLAASGLLTRKIGGPSIRPPLPKDIAALGYANSVKWAESKGAEKYRRGLYIFFQRSVPYPMLLTFDAPDATSICTARERSNTPLQALTLLNDPVFFECARALGKRIDSEIPSADRVAKLRHGFKLCTAREPSGAELERLQQMFDRQFALTKSKPELAGLALGEPQTAANLVERATLVALSRVMLNLDEFITRE